MLRAAYSFRADWVFCKRLIKDTSVNDWKPGIYCYSIYAINLKNWSEQASNLYSASVSMAAPCMISLISLIRSLSRTSCTFSCISSLFSASV